MRHTIASVVVDVPKQGERVRIHPASDWFIRGETYATVLFWRKGRARVQGERSGKRFWLADYNILEVLSY